MCAIHDSVAPRPHQSNEFLSPALLVRPTTNNNEFTWPLYYNYHSIPTTYYGVPFMFLLLTPHSTQPFLNFKLRLNSPGPLMDDWKVTDGSSVNFHDMFLFIFCQIIAKNEEKHIMKIYGWVIHNFPVVCNWTMWIRPKSKANLPIFLTGDPSSSGRKAEGAGRQPTCTTCALGCCHSKAHEYYMKTINAEEKLQ